MSELLTDVRVFNMALATFGGTPVQSFDAETPTARTARLVYEERRAFCLGLYPWSFSKKTEQLAKADNIVSFHGYRNAYALPAHRLGQPFAVAPTRIMPDQPFNQYDIHGALVFCDSDQLFALIRYRPEEKDWPPTFLSLVVKAVAAVAAISIGHDKELAKTYHAEAFGPPQMNYRGGLARTAIDADSHATPPKRIEASGGLLVDAWMGRRLR